MMINSGAAPARTNVSTPSSQPPTSLPTPTPATVVVSLLTSPGELKQFLIECSVNNVLWFYLGYLECQFLHVHMHK